MTAWEQASRQVDRLYAYAFQLYDQDTRVGRALQMQQEMSQVYSQFQSAISFMRPEILAIGRDKIDAFLAAGAAARASTACSSTTSCARRRTR